MVNGRLILRDAPCRALLRKRIQCGLMVRSGAEGAASRTISLRR
jgi:hypothetical protein